MGSYTMLFSFLIVGLAVFMFVKVKPIFDVPEKPDLGEKWWKLSKPDKVDTSIRPFKIQIPDEVLTDLKDRLRRALPLQKSIEGTAQHYGMNDKLLKSIVDFWLTKYNWREREKFLNQYPQFKTNIQGLDIHFLHVKPTQTQNVTVLPLLMLSGFPGSIRDFYEIIPFLTKPIEGQEFVFEVIVPSNPGSIFSEAAEVTGLSAPQMAVIFKNLMDRLGFKKYYIRGFGWGDTLVSTMSTLFPEKIIGMHNGLCFINTPLSNLKLALGSFFPSLIIEEKYQHLVYPRMKRIEYLMLELGYMHIQVTKPNTIGVALRDSPVGLAAYILEKFTTWTNPGYKDLEDGGLTKKYKMEALLDNVMLHWLSKSIITGIRMYAETFSKEGSALLMQIDSIPTYVPAACERHEYDLDFMPETIIRDKYKNLVQLTTSKTGGFSDLEIPQKVAVDIIKFVEKVEYTLQNSKL